VGGEVVRVFAARGRRVVEVVVLQAALVVAEVVVVD
jgi:hypothetical protein